MSEKENGRGLCGNIIQVSREVMMGARETDLQNKRMPPGGFVYSMEDLQSARRFDLLMKHEALRRAGEKLASMHVDSFEGELYCKRWELVLQLHKISVNCMRLR